MTTEQPERSRAKTRITIRIDGEVLDWFRKQASGGGNYQTAMNDALREHVTRSEGTLAETLRRVVREELAREAKAKKRKARRKARTASRRKRPPAQTRSASRGRARRRGQLRPRSRGKRARKGIRRRHK
jgi:hypothetical protein